MSEDRMTDGADKRRRRLLDLLQEMKTQDGMTLLQIQGYMMPMFGLKFDTTEKYLREMHLASMVKDTGRKWKVTRVPIEE
jgi:hypothetical protein